MFIRTSRLLLRPHFPDDARELCAAIADERVVGMLSRAPWPYMQADAESFCARPLDPFRLNFAVTLPEFTGAPIIGGVGLDCGEDEPELGYWIAPEFWGQGYASEAVGAILEVAQLRGLEPVAAGHFVENPASGRVLQKAGFKPTGEVIDTPCRARGGALVPAKRYRKDRALRQDITLTVAA